MTRFLVLNFVGFQLLWAGSVIGAGAYSLHLVAALTAAPLLILSFWSEHRNADWMVAAIALAVGLLLDNIWIFLDVLAYPSSSFAPYWIGLLWIGFALTINHSMSWFRDRRVLGPLIVGVFAPITYLAGARFGAVEVLNTPGLVVISIAWAGLFFGLSSLARDPIEPEATRA